MIILSLVKEHVETSTLGTINTLMHTLIHCNSPLVEKEPSVHCGHMWTSCGFICTFGCHVGDSMDDGLVTNQILSQTFGIDT